MGVDIKLVNRISTKIVTVDHHSEGGQYVLSGIDLAKLYITYNYSEVYKLLENYQGMVETFDGKKASDLLPWLEKGVEKLGVERYKDYWAPTPGNAGYALSILLEWAKQYPDAIFEAEG